MAQLLSSETSTRIAAGAFGEWLAQARASLRGEGGADVPCGDCVGCCTSWYPVPIRPKDKLALAEIPVRFLTTAHNGQAMMVALSDGTCPMLSAGKCSIYAQRPQTCRDYDCRVFAAAGIAAGGEDRSAINRRVREWHFTYSTEEDQAAHAAVRSAAAFIQEKRDRFPGRVPTAPTGIAVLAIKVYAIFLDLDIQTKSDEDIARAIVETSRKFDAGLLS
jgi:Fe-S-cluster containining protein